MERYFTHLIPFLLLPASYGLLVSLREVKLRSNLKTSIALFLILLLIQTMITYNGLRSSQDSSWFRISYEERATKVIASSLPKGAWLIVSEPEPYFYNLHITTYSVTDSYPFIFIDGGNDNQKIIIVEDMGMHLYFPHFTNFLEMHLKSFETKRFFVHENYHIETMTKKEMYPIVIYTLTLKELKTAISQTNF